MPRIATELSIAAPPPRVWRALVDRSRWGRFSDFVDLDPGRPLVEGSRFWLGLRLAGPLSVPIRVRVIRRVEEKALAWVGGGPGIHGEHWFGLEPIGEGWTLLRHGEDFSGPLGELLVKVGGTFASERYAAFNRGLAHEVEPQPTEP